MFKRIDTGASGTAAVAFTWDGHAMMGAAGDTVASALLGAGIHVNREHPVTGEPRAPYCMMGICFDCLVEIDGVPNRQACQVRLAEGMCIRPQRGARS